jgi:hypothetical protein
MFHHKEKDHEMINASIKKKDYALRSVWERGHCAV